MAQDDANQALLAEYAQVTSQFRELTQIRFKLLTYLPLGTIGTSGILAHQEEASRLALPFALFGFFVTIALFVYNLRNDQHYDELVGRAAQIERDLKLFDGSFAQRPDKWHRLGPGLYVEHRWPIHLVYIVSAALWAWLGLHTLPYMADAIRVTIAIALASFMMWYLGYSQQASRERYRTAARSAMQLLVDSSLGLEAQQRAIEAGRVLALHLGGGREAARRFEDRIGFYLKADNAQEFMPRREGSRLDIRTASYVLGQTIDMPARWIRDIHTGRRGS